MPIRCVLRSLRGRGSAEARLAEHDGHAGAGFLEPRVGDGTDSVSGMFMLSRSRVCPPGRDVGNLSPQSCVCCHMNFIYPSAGWPFKRSKLQSMPESAVESSTKKPDALAV